MKYTIYRATHAFMDALNRDKALLGLHRSRSCSFFDDTERKQETVDAINTMLIQGHLVPAAQVEAASKNELFRLTNTINKPWTENTEVSLIENSDAFLSSSSVGDIFVDENGLAYLIESYGFTLLNVENREPLQVSLA